MPNPNELNELANLEIIRRKMELEEPVKKPILCLDFDGVLHSYKSGWRGVGVISDPPVDGMVESLYSYLQEFEVHIFSTRSASNEGVNAMMEWLGRWEDIYWRERPNLPRPRTALVLNVKFPRTKPSAFVGIDDRVLTFNGKFPDVMELKNFKPWNK